jgi:hypothetical protein
VRQPNQYRAAEPVPVERRVDYNRDLHTCRACGTVLQLDVVWRRIDKDADPSAGVWWVVTECRCGPYSTEAGGYAQRSSALTKRRRLLAAVPDDNHNERFIYRSGDYWSVEIKRKGFKYTNRCKSKQLAIALRDQALLEAA